MAKAIFLDRDGTIVEDKGYTHKVSDFRLLKNSVNGLKMLKGYSIFIVTNQSGIGRGYYSLNDFNEFNDSMAKELEKSGIKIKKIYYCPHHPEDKCSCRKPKIKMLKDAEKEFGAELKKSYVIGDMKKDVEMGKKAGCKTIIIKGKNDSWRQANADFAAIDLKEAAKWILKNDKE